MVSVLVVMNQIFPYDPAIDTPLGHRNLVLIYCITWGIHLAYATYAFNKWRMVRR
jgi:hypothetical protein